MWLYYTGCTQKNQRKRTPPKAAAIRLTLLFFPMCTKPRARYQNSEPPNQRNRSRLASGSNCTHLKEISPLQYHILNNYWMRSSRIWGIIKAEVCVICRSRRLRQITQTEALIIAQIVREPNSIIVLLFICICKTFPWRSRPSFLSSFANKCNCSLMLPLFRLCRGIFIYRKDFINQFSIF